ncbi:MAG TPA: hypothetical protein DD723_08965 [Candidatus Omnitrophica bacterium]|nr:MAG: hypothetical protein A2Z81_08565 [Omnitrophica WOR_2 bacterium GWA2_45_18]OGX19348.1 MAG: hypothetical protein A2Y04_01910 [Omnitrophica WOR_2 bacterium GWC2_45_7]HBR15647.1 hypothetical protein [Candidatus Omnitrophota bacterium]
MSLTLFFYSSFDRSLHTLDRGQIEIVRRILKALTVYYESNCSLEDAQKIESRFFYKQLRKPYYEAGIENKIRVVIERVGSECIAILAGNHDQVKRFLANQ